jgi:hypothetical protein
MDHSKPTEWDVTKTHGHRPRMALRVLLPMLAGIASCGYFTEGKYFQSRVDEATQQMVDHRYGRPHKIRSEQDGGETWTYYERGSATASFAGRARDSFCRAYQLTFDRQGILKVWKQEHCRQ